MNDITKYYGILGLKPDSSLGEVKEAYRDLVKVWHPGRFSHDPKLQLKAQEKLKEINEAYQKIQVFLDNLSSYQQATGTSEAKPSEEKTYASPDAEQASAQDKKESNNTSQPPPEPSEDDKPTQQITLPTKPWVRFWARTLDMFLFSIPPHLVAPVFGYSLGRLFPDFTIRASGGFWLLFAFFIVLPFIVITEAFVIALFGNTPGKAILKTKVTNAEGKNLSFAEALKRSFSVYFYGLALGIPIITFFTYLWQYERLENTGKTSWDSKFGFNVTHAPINGIKIADYVLLYIVGFAILAIINGINRGIIDRYLGSPDTDSSVDQSQFTPDTPADNIVGQKSQPPVTYTFKDDSPAVKESKQVYVPNTSASSQPKQYKLAIPPKRFFEKLAQLVPDWQAINDDPNFREWLRQADANSQETRDEKMLKAYSNNNVV